jgi:hypothetical protein
MCSFKKKFDFLLICSGGLVKTTPVFTFLDMNNEVKGA